MRAPFSSRHSVPESDTSLSDLESDFESAEADLTELESDFEEEEVVNRRRVARKTHAGSRVTHAARKQSLTMTVSNISSSDTLQINPLNIREPGSAGDNQNDTSVETLVVKDKEEPKAGLPQHGCCSCNQRSGCKTKKCECKAAGGFCGLQCGCKAGRCANRLEKASVEVAPTASNEMAQAMACLRVESPQQRANQGEIVLVQSPHTEQGLVKKAAMLLDTAWKERTQSPDSSEENIESGTKASSGAQAGNWKLEVGSKRPRRPLSDIGNKVWILHCFLHDVLLSVSTYFI